LEGPHLKILWPLFAEKIMLDITKTKVVYQWKHDSPLIACRISPAGKEAVSTSEDSAIIRWKIENGEKAPMIGHESWVHAIAYSSDGNQLVSGAPTPTMEISLYRAVVRAG